VSFLVLIRGVIAAWDRTTAVRISFCTDSHFFFYFQILNLAQTTIAARPKPSGRTVALHKIGTSAKRAEAIWGRGNFQTTMRAFSKSLVIRPVLGRWVAFGQSRAAKIAA
jgi:hypothetical protein